MLDNPTRRKHFRLAKIREQEEEQQEELEEWEDSLIRDENIPFWAQMMGEDYDV